MLNKHQTLEHTRKSSWKWTKKIQKSFLIYNGHSNKKFETKKMRLCIPK